MGVSVTFNQTNNSAEHCAKFKYNELREEMRMWFLRRVHHEVTMLQSEIMANNINSTNVKLCSMRELQAITVMESSIRLKKKKAGFIYIITHTCNLMISLLLSFLGPSTSYSYFVLLHNLQSDRHTEDPQLMIIAWVLKMSIRYVP